MLVKLELTIPFYNLILFIKNLTLKTRNWTVQLENDVVHKKRKLIN